MRGGGILVGLRHFLRSLHRFLLGPLLTYGILYAILVRVPETKTTAIRFCTRPRISILVIVFRCADLRISS